MTDADAAGTDAAGYWDAEAAGFDDQVDHGLRDPSARRAWQRLLEPYLPRAGARVADLGCGTGTLTGLLTELGLEVAGLDISPQMITRARLKVPAAEFVVGDAANPSLPAGSFDLVLSRHVLWALPDPEAGLQNWLRLLVPAGALLLVEGFWSTGAGLRMAETRDLVARHRHEVTVVALTDPVLWGGPISDERYLVHSPA